VLDTCGGLCYIYYNIFYKKCCSIFLEAINMVQLEQLRDIIVNTLGCDESAVTEEASITEDLGADSLAVVDLVMAIEDAFGVTIDEEALKTVITVGDILKLLA
jgi:acyl carrier protein